jgi:hypothetical protein
MFYGFGETITNIIKGKKMNTRFLVYYLAFSLLFVDSLFSFDSRNQPDSSVISNTDTTWYNVTSFEIEGKGWTETKSFYDRLPAKAEKLVPEKVWQLSSNSAGLCFRFITDAKSFKIKWELLHPMIQMNHMPATGVSGIDIYKRDKDGNWFYFATGRPNKFPVNAASFSDKDTSEVYKEYLVNLPLYNGVSKVEIGLPAGTNLKNAEKKSIELKPLLFYGTSITQGGCASRPGLAHPAIIGRKLNCPAINLGFSGSGKMEIELAHLIAEIDASIYILDCVWNMTSELIEERMEPFVKYLKEKRPTTPILLVENSWFKNVFPTKEGEVYRKVYQKLLDEDVTGLYFLEGKNLIGSDGEGTVDGVHPNDLGFMRQADAFIPVIKSILTDDEKK